MQQTQFFLFGLLVIWLVGTGKLAAFVDALRNTPSGGNPPSQGTPGGGIHPCSDDPSKMCINDENGNELHIMG